MNDTKRYDRHEMVGRLLLTPDGDIMTVISSAASCSGPWLCKKGCTGYLHVMRASNGKLQHICHVYITPRTGYKVVC